MAGLFRPAAGVPAVLLLAVIGIRETIVPRCAGAQAAPADVVRTVIYVASAEREDLAAVWAALRASPIAEALTSASTLLGVAQLGFTGQLVEVDVTAALSR